jgi:uncharacterized protein YgiM (DUF1202 family)
LTWGVAAEQENPTMRYTLATATAVALLGLLAAAPIEAAQAASPQASAPAPAISLHNDAETTMQVSHAYAHVRKEPSTKSPVLATLKKGAKVTVLGKSPDGKWVHVKSGKVEGYVAATLLKA